MHYFIIFRVGWIVFLAQLTFIAQAVEFDSNTDVERLVYLLRHSEDPAVRSRAAWAIGWYDHTKAAIYLISALEDDAFQVRQEAADALRSVGDENAIPFLIHRCEVDETAGVRARAVRSIGWIAFKHKIQPIYAIPFIVNLLRHDENLEVRVLAAKTLGMIKHENAGPTLVEMLIDSENDVRMLSAWALGEIEYAEAVPSLLKVMGDEDPDVRMMVAYALSEISKRDEVVISKVVTYLKVADKNIRTTVVWVLGMSHHKIGLPFLEIALKDEEKEVRLAAIVALYNYGFLASSLIFDLEVLAKVDKEPDVRQAALQILSTLR